MRQRSFFDFRLNFRYAKIRFILLAAAERMLEKAPAAACSRDNICVRPDTGDTGETALLPGTGAKVEAKGLEPLTSR